MIDHFGGLERAVAVMRLARHAYQLAEQAADVPASRRPAEMPADWGPPEITPSVADGEDAALRTDDAAAKIYSQIMAGEDRREIGESTRGSETKLQSTASPWEELSKKAPVFIYNSRTGEHRTWWPRGIAGEALKQLLEDEVAKAGFSLEEAGAAVKRGMTLKKMTTEQRRRYDALALAVYRARQQKATGSEIGAVIGRGKQTISNLAERGKALAESDSARPAA